MSWLFRLNLLNGLRLNLGKLLRDENAHERTKRIKSTALANIAAKLIGIAVSVITVPLTLGYLGQERYGLWMVIASLIAFLQLSDLGISNALVGMVASKKAQGNEGELRALMIYAAKFLFGISIIIFIIGTLVIFTADWVSLFNVKDALAKSELKTSLFAFLILFCINMPLGIAQQTRAGMQQGYLNAVFGALGQLLNLALIFIVVHNKGGLPWLIGASMTGSIALQLSNLLLLFLKIKKNEKDKYKKFIHQSDLIKKGMLFFILQICVLVSYESDVLVVSHFLAPAAVTEYSVTLKIFSLPGMLLSFFFVGMWPAYSDALARNDKVWIINCFWRSLKRSLLLNTILSLCLFFFGAWIINIWTKGVVQPGIELLLGMMFWGILNAFGGNTATLLNGLHIVGFQVVLSVAAAILNIALSILLVRSIGVSGPIWGSVIALSIAYLISMVFIVRLLKGWNVDKTN